MFKLVRALGVLIGAFILINLINFALITWWTSDPMIVRPEALADGASTVEATLGLASGEQSEKAEALQLSVAYDGLMAWSFASAVLAALFIALWFALVFLREQRTFGPASQSAAKPIWFGLMLLYVIGSGGIYFQYIVPMNLLQGIFPFDIYFPSSVVTLVGLFVSWIASIFGIGAVLRPSVPVGARFS